VHADPPRRLARVRGTRWVRVTAALALAIALLAAARALRGRAVGGWAVERRTLVQRVVASGRVMAPARIALAALALSKVVAVAVDEGDRVRRGQLLVRLDDADARAALQGARARVLEAAARLDQVRGPGARNAAEALRQAELKVALAEREWERIRRIGDAGGASAAQVDDAEKALAVARSAREGAAAQAASLAGGGADERLAVASLEVARAAEAQARARLDEKELRAPADATVIARDVEPGDAAAAGKTLLVLARAGDTRLSVQPDEKNLALLACGQRARAVADAFPDAPFDATLAFIAPSVDAARGTVEVRLAVPAPPPFLRPDMTVSVNVEVARREGALVVPADALREDAGGPHVLVDADGRAARRAVKVGARGEGVVEILSGVAEGDLVVGPAARVAPGDRVRVAQRPLPAEPARAL
jgi:HlyD family secretion protein